VFKEDFYEEGIVREVKQGTAVVKLRDSENCSECALKLYCSSGDSNERQITARDPFRTHPGDSVRILIRGSKILSASVLLYGIPLLILIIAIPAGMMIFEKNRELFSSLFAFGLIGLYGFIFSFFLKKDKVNRYPEVVFVNPKKN
jgi:positive regulator of sigma E activity